ncbi:MAG: hypothetical protein F6K48_14285 [Okeania sp. SIO3H1]|uniref:hypothetical protein n=1 Tax=Okeania sp. SIO1I7 TaxID=2607772 RepID=UPI0013CD43AA|nr:hypothetical protein [Okeania sp. SIO1I7]NEN90014.1 hypothetical protein [Okeania sp. SIO3H1]NET24971.1 hypothetical protein [Okeania sp. SIO1I7]
METKNEESEAQGVRRDEGYFNDSPGNSNSSQWIGGASGEDGGIQSRLDREDRSSGDSFRFCSISLFGKILDRLITSWEDREKEATDCLDWYQNQVNRCQQEIKSLEEIKAELTKNTEGK